MKGYIYALTNKGMPGLVKIGRTKNNPEKRADDLQTTGVPYPFEVALKLKVADCYRAESILHSRFQDKRVSGREFFKVGIEEVNIATQQLPPEVRGTLSTQQRPRANQHKPLGRYISNSTIKGKVKKVYISKGEKFGIGKKIVLIDQGFFSEAKDLTTSSGGTVENILIKEGAKLKKGDPIFSYIENPEAGKDPDSIPPSILKRIFWGVMLVLFLILLGYLKVTNK